MTAIDLGSNTIRFLNFDCNEKKELASFERVVRTAEGMHHSGEISPDALNRIIEAIEDADRTIGLEPHIKATATAAFRKATNSKSAIDRIYEATGITFEVIGADREAELAGLALFEAAQKIETVNDLFILDIGGASTEVIYTDGSSRESLSFDVGIVTAANTYGLDETALIDSLAPMLNSIRTFIATVSDRYKKPDVLAATAGTPTTLAALKLGMTYATYDKEKINGTVLSLKDIDQTYKTLQAMDEATRETIVGSKRGDLVMCGVVIFREIFKTFAYEQCVVYDDGVREGIALAECKRLNH